MDALDQQQGGGGIPQIVEADDGQLRLRLERPNHVWSYDFVMDTTLAPAVSRFLDQQEDFVGGVSLFARQFLALFQ